MNLSIPPLYVYRNVEVLYFESYTHYYVIPKNPIECTMYIQYDSLVVHNNVHCMWVILKCNT